MIITQKERGREGIERYIQWKRRRRRRRVGSSSFSCLRRLRMDTEGTMDGMG